MIQPGAVLTLDVQKPAGGGRMLARHEGQVVLLWGAIPGERVRARVDRHARGVLYAETLEVLAAVPDRRQPEGDWRCGGNVFAHIAYERQLAIKGEIVQDAFGRIARVPLAAPPVVAGSPERGYRMRARLHARDGRIGFYREETHDLCDATAAGQFLPETNDWIRQAQDLLRDQPGLAGLELTENVRADERAHHFLLREGADAGKFSAISARLGAARQVTDDIAGVQLRRDVRTFFQGNRFLVERLVRHVASLVPDGPIVDLYAGVGLFGLSLAAAGARRVVLVEGDPIGGADLEHNARPFGERVRVERRSVEDFLRSYTPPRGASVIVDPPRTGMSREALARLVRMRRSHLIYVSCDPATLARDTRTLLENGYDLGAIGGFDLFPNTAHVETVVTFNLAP